jgi:hypothetical protein
VSGIKKFLIRHQDQPWIDAVAQWNLPLGIHGRELLEKDIFACMRILPIVRFNIV